MGAVDASRAVIPGVEGVAVSHLDISGVTSSLGVHAGIGGVGAAGPA